jgi:hypothetical protein
MGADPDKTRLSQWRAALLRLRALGEARLIWVDAHQMTRAAEGALFSHSFQWELYVHFCCIFHSKCLVECHQSNHGQDDGDRSSTASINAVALI